MMESHLAEKKRMVEKFEEQTNNYAKYYQFYHDNAGKLEEMTKKLDEMVTQQAKLQELTKQQQLQQQLQQQQIQQQKASSEKPCETCGKYTEFCDRLKTILMDSLHEIMRNDKSDRYKVGHTQRLLVNSLNEVKSASRGDFNFRSVTSSSDLLTTPDVKTYHTDNDELIRSVEEALMIVRQDSCKKSQFKSQPSFAKIEPRKTPEPEYLQKKLFDDAFSQNSQSSKNLRQPMIDVRQSVNTHIIGSGDINDSFGKVDPPPHSTKNKELKYNVEFLGKTEYEGKYFIQT